ncbi:uncharacterized protein LOC108101792 [Drosophila ficusphila]|uniref:uncharacterized protein LOC108101792 n=1 Tax=Drosophila ficusphila TaxID=30025 RepID=UPI0007E78846|nr:uncharacterized protein LOC108101792 [Drosophila ficusphila]
MAWLIIVLLCLGNSGAQFLDEENTNKLEQEQRLISLLIKLQKEKFYSTLLIYGEHCVFPSLSNQLQFSTVLVPSGSTNFEWNFSSLALILSCGYEAEKEENYRTQIKLQSNPRLVILQEDIQPEFVCDHFSKREQYNVAMVTEDFYRSNAINSCRHFQDPNYEEVNLLDGKPIFTNQFRNMHGAPIRTITDDVAPRSMVTEDPKTGEKKWIGYVANVLNNFVQKVNASLEMQEGLTEAGGTVFFMNVSKWAADDLLDIGMSVEADWDMSSFDTLTYPYLISSYCFMVPLPDQVPYSWIFGIILDIPVLGILLVLFCIFSLLLIYIQQRSWRGLSLTSVLMNDVCLRGFLGQPFPFPQSSSRKLKLACLLLCFSGLMTTTMYGAYLKTYLYRPPPRPFMRTVRDFQTSRYKMALNWAAINTLRYENKLKMAEESEGQVEVFENYSEFLQLRSSFDNNYIFPVTSVRWGTYKEQQKLFDQPIFYYSEDFCLSRHSFLSFPVRRRLPYRDLFEEHILRQKEFGLLNHWIDSSFLDMLRLGLTPYTDFGKPPDEDAIDIDDLYWVLGLYIFALGISCCCFGLELLVSLTFWSRFKTYKWKWTTN